MNRLNGAAQLGAGAPTAPRPDDPAEAAEVAPAVVDALRGLLAGPTGLGTSAARLFRTDLTP
ncbi:hypothetical protein, partial [Streptomyces sp. UNOB3_S3]|uniref:hypothetical protein n=1 Tax=Streptomyces sp. UNOB3_S3 TaxID=2871682 RepID=UPI001E62C734